MDKLKSSAVDIFGNWWIKNNALYTKLYILGLISKY